eukprot:7970-Heterococcus_DN1.PRE.1
MPTAGNLKYKYLIRRRPSAEACSCSRDNSPSWSIGSVGFTIALASPSVRSHTVAAGRGTRRRHGHRHWTHTRYRIPTVKPLARSTKFTVKIYPLSRRDRPWSMAGGLVALSRTPASTNARYQCIDLMWFCVIQNHATGVHLSPPVCTVVLFQNRAVAV